MHLRTILFCLLLSPLLSAAPAVSLFDGKTFDGWEGATGTVWRIVDGTIVGGSLEGNPRNEFLATKKPYKNFILRLEYKLQGTEGFVNGGVQFRSRRIEQPPNEMIGYQADIGAGYSGALYDESRRKRMLAQPAKELIEAAEKPGEWNRYEIRAEDHRIQLFVNGKRTVDYTEREPGIEKDGFIALQIHGNCRAEIAFRNLTLEMLPDDLVPDAKSVLNRFGDPGAPRAPLAPFKDGAFQPGAGETVIFAGQTNFVRDQRVGELESRLSAAFADLKPRFRSMAWEGDTVHEQWRDLNFGSWQDQLDAAGATTIIAQFGQTEAFDGKEALPRFSSGYHRLLDQFTARTPRLVLVSPMPFEKPLSPHAPDLTQRNADVAAYAQAVRDIAKQRGAVFVDLFTPLSQRPDGSPRLTDNGLHLNDEGLRVVADLIASQLGASSGSSHDLTSLRNAIAEKNRLWADCWRPANWSFVYGDRVTQMFGKAGERGPTLRESFEAHKPLIARLDADIHAIALGKPPEPPPAQAPVPAVVTDPIPSPAEMQQSFTVAEGWNIQPFATEDQGVVKPVQFAWDERGRLWVACSPTYPQTIAGVKPSDFILVLQDTDGDGRADKSHRFAEGLTMVQGLELGEGGLFVCDFDQIIHLRDTDNDGRADTKRTVFSGFGIGDTHQLANSISYAPDGSLWFTQGLHAFSRIETPWGLSRLDKAGVWKLDPRTLKLEGYFNGGKAGHNCWGVAFDDFHQPFHKSGDRPHGYWSLPGFVAAAEPDDYHPVAPLFDTSPKTTALDIIGTAALPDEVQGCAVIGGYFGNVVELHRFIDDGAGFRTEQLPKLIRSKSTAFRPVDVSVGPDGAIYLADWCNPVIGHYQASYADARRDRVHGRIWRITAQSRQPVKQPALAEMNAAQLVELLRSPERWTRQQAGRLLFNRTSEEVLAAADAFLAKFDSASPNAGRVLLDLCGIFEAHKSPRPALLDKLQNSDDPRVRACGARVAGAWADQLPDAVARLQKAVADPHPRVRLEAVVACGHITSLASAETVLLSFEKPADKFIDYARIQVLRHLRPVWLKAQQEGKFAGPSAEKATLLARLASSTRTAEHPGKVIYDTLCLNCHQPSGSGLPGVYPSVAQSDWINGDVTRLAKIMLHGLTGPITVNGTPFTQVAPIPMPPMGLDDQQAADVLTWLRSNFGNNADPVTAAQIKAVREATAGRTTFWTAEELAH